MADNSEVEQYLEKHNQIREYILTLQNENKELKSKLDEQEKIIEELKKVKILSIESTPVKGDNLESQSTNSEKEYSKDAFKLFIQSKKELFNLSTVCGQIFYEKTKFLKDYLEHYEIDSLKKHEDYLARFKELIKEFKDSENKMHDSLPRNSKSNLHLISRIKAISTIVRDHINEIKNISNSMNDIVLTTLSEYKG